MKKAKVNSVIILAFAFILSGSIVAAGFKTENTKNKIAVANFSNDTQLSNGQKSYKFPEKLTIGGKTVGIKIFSDGILVTSISNFQTEKGNASPSSDAGLKAGDVLTKINSQRVNTIEELKKAIEDNKGKDLSVEFLRNNKPLTTNILPQKDIKDNQYKLGIFVRDSMAGIGTVTFYDKQTKQFGALGHSINDIDTNKLINVLSGAIMPSTVSGATRGQVGTPGELISSFDLTKDIGTIEKNTESGIFGFVTDQSFLKNSYEAEIGTKDNVKEGQISIICDVDSKGPKEYSAEITRIYSRDAKTKNFMIQITDKDLLAKTGGIVQGMSGSPILQNGKIIGAVTHVLVNDPQRGYGIFIENMLEKIFEKEQLQNAA